MSKKIVIKKLSENEKLRLDSDFPKEQLKRLLDSSDLPIQLSSDENYLLFESYTIGTILLGEMQIQIVPRNKNLSLSNYLEMFLYAEGLFRDDSTITSVKDNADPQLELALKFVAEVKKLLEESLDGSFNYLEEKNSKIRGRILTEKLSLIDLKLEQIPIEYPFFSFEILPNLVIKHALEKVRYIVTNEYIDQFNEVYSKFDEIDISDRDANRDSEDIKYSEFIFDSKYKTVLELAQKVLSAIAINIDGRNNSSTSAFLFNSNDIYEKYVLKVLKDNLSIPVEKWNKPKVFARLSAVNGAEIEKSYVPDILINYNPTDMRSDIVLDAKNKDITDFNKLGNVSDLYQLFFYKNILNSRYSGLVYPSAQKINAGRIDYEGYPDMNAYYFVLDFSKTLKDRHLQFITEIKETFLIS